MSRFGVLDYDHAGKPLFDKEKAAAYDAQWKPLSPLNAALHLLSRSILCGLPENARILCAGAGTGAEIIYLAGVFSEWRFVGFDPSGPMLEICRDRLASAGLTARCELHEGYIESLPDCEPFDAATSFLVSHFLTKETERGAYFRAIGDRLRSGALFVNADLAADKQHARFPDLMQIWLDAISLTGASKEALDAYKAMFGVEVAAQTPAQVETLIAANGFTQPVRFYQAAMIHAWFCQRL